MRPIQDVREDVIRSVRPEEAHAVSQVLPFQYNNWIDGMAWCGIACGACHKYGDLEIANLLVRYLANLVLVGEDARNFVLVDARNFAPEPVSNDWIQSTNIDGMWYRKKPQSFAGPVGLYYAIDCGAGISPGWVKSPYFRARVFTWFGSWFGSLVRHFSWLKQHVNSMFLAYLLLHKKPPQSMQWLAYDNPFYSYIYGIPLSTQWPGLCHYSDAYVEDCSTLVPFSDREPDSWVAKNWPYKKYVRNGDPLPRSYVPFCELAGRYLQSTLSGESP